MILLISGLDKMVRLILMLAALPKVTLFLVIGIITVCFINNKGFK